MYRSWRWTRSEDPRQGFRRDLMKNTTWHVRPGRRGLVIRAELGTVVVTQEGDLEDHVLEAGEELRVSRGGVVVAWALTPARLATFEPPHELKGRAALSPPLVNAPAATTSCSGRAPSAPVMAASATTR